MGMCCKLAGLKYGLEHRYPVIVKLERRMRIVEKELNRDNPCIVIQCGRRRGRRHRDER